MRDNLAITGVDLTTVILVFSTIFVAGTGFSVPAGGSLPSTAPAPLSIVSMSPTSTVVSTQAATLSVVPALVYPTKVSQLLSSAVVVVKLTPTAVAKGLAINGGLGIGHAYGVVKQTISLTSVVIKDQVTITGINGTIPGHMDMVQVQAHYNGDTTPYCTKTIIFDATGLSSYSTSFQCSYLGAGTYNFKVTVYDDNGTIIGDPTFSLVL